MIYIQKILLFVIYVFNLTEGSHVLELSDKFLDVHTEGKWLVMMYAPWCGHCKRLEPTWELVATSLNDSPIKVGKVDCTRFSSVASFFKIRGYPTILFLKGDQKFVYNGDRSRDEIVQFALKLLGPTVKEITDSSSLDSLKYEKGLYFLYVGEKEGSLWDVYYDLAKSHQSQTYFYQYNANIVDKSLPIDKLPAILVHKNQNYYTFSEFSDDKEKLNETLHNWFYRERFSMFPKVTRGNINQLYTTKKNLVFAVVDENNLENSFNTIKLKDMIESLIKEKYKKYHRDFQFGWIANPEIANSIALTNIPVPNLIVVNSTTNYYHIPEIKSEELTSDYVESFLNDIISDTAPKYGGNGFFAKLQRIWFELKSSLIQIWKGNPILTFLIFGLPSIIIFIMCKIGICCPEISEEEETEENENEETDHEKNE